MSSKLFKLNIAKVDPQSQEHLEREVRCHERATTKTIRPTSKKQRRNKRKHKIV